MSQSLMKVYEVELGPNPEKHPDIHGSSMRVIAPDEDGAKARAADILNNDDCADWVVLRATKLEE